MPAPKNLERIESPGNNTPPPSERMERNNGAATNLTKAKKPSFREELDREASAALNEYNARVLRLDRAAQDVFEEGNRGEEAWHNAMRGRRNETRTQAAQRETWQRTDEVENLRNGVLNGRPRENSTHDIGWANETRKKADKIRQSQTADTVFTDPLISPEIKDLDTYKPSPSPPQSPKKPSSSDKKEKKEQIADLGNKIDV